MSLADLLTSIGIVVSILFGSLITRYTSIKDARTRVIKDYYIEQLKQIKGKVDLFFHRVAFGKMSSPNIVIWYEHIKLDIDSIEDGIRSSLDIQIDKFCNRLDDYYGEITGWDDYNDQYSQSRYIPDNNHKVRLKKMKYDTDNFLNSYIQHVNQANTFSILKLQCQRVRQSTMYYRREGLSYAFVRALFERFNKHCLELVVIIGCILGVIYLLFNLEEEKKQDLVTPLKEISAKQDSICKSIHLFMEKYEPIKVNTKTFHNSAFFNAEKIDSVHVKLFQNK